MNTESYFFDKCGINDVYDFKNKERSIRYYTRYMLNRTIQMFDYKNLPDTISKRNLEMILQCYGFAGILKVDGELYAFFGGLGGEPDAYYMPTLLTVANSYLKYSKNLKIDEDCIVIPSDATYTGLLPWINKCASMLVENELSMSIVVIMERLTALLTATTDREKVAVDKLIEDIYKGKLASVLTNKVISDGISALPFSNNGGHNNITQLIEHEQYWKAELFNFLGLQANYNMKREAINSNEAQLNDDMLFPLVDDMLEQRKLGIERVNEKFGTNISVEFSGVWKRNQEEAKKELELISKLYLNDKIGNEDNEPKEDGADDDSENGK